MEQRVGIGYDIHRLVEGRSLFLGGVDILISRACSGILMPMCFYMLYAMRS